MDFATASVDEMVEAVRHEVEKNLRKAGNRTERKSIGEWSPITLSEDMHVIEDNRRKRLV